jgi:phosphoribosylaminoimidazole carboxylase (NCAIR synthetase)
MLNVLSKMPDNIDENSDEYKLYDYGKSERENRKLGHITLTSENKKDLLSKISKLKDKIF